MEVIEFPADWEKYGKSAGFKRNGSIVGASDCVVCFWNEVSRGCLDTARKAVAAGKPVYYIYEDLTGFWDAVNTVKELSVQRMSVKPT